MNVASSQALSSLPHRPWLWCDRHSWREDTRALLVAIGDIDIGDIDTGTMGTGDPVPITTVGTDGNTIEPGVLEIARHVHRHAPQWCLQHRCDSSYSVRDTVTLSRLVLVYLRRRMQRDMLRRVHDGADSEYLWMYNRCIEEAVYTGRKR